MCYEERFYIGLNIVGFTGDLNNNPTVYFHDNSSGKYGHITQDHTIKENIGRGMVGDSSDYSARNEVVDGELVLVEREGKDVIHTSRNKMKMKRTLSTPVLEILVRSIEAHKERKKWDWLTHDQQEEILNRMSKEKRKTINIGTPID